MKCFLAILIICISNPCKSQDAGKELYFPQVGWRIFIPKNTESFSSFQFDSLMEATSKKINTQLDFGDTKLLFLIKHGQYSFFGSTLNLFDSIHFKNWESSYVNFKKVLIDLLESQSDKVTLKDTSSSTEKIGGLLFQKFLIISEYPGQKIVMRTTWWYRKQGKYELSINIASNDNDIQAKYLEVLRKSKFGN